MTINRLVQAYEGFHKTHCDHKNASHEKYTRIKESDAYTLLDRQERILDKLERAKYDYLMLSIDQFKAHVKELAMTCGHN